MSHADRAGLEREGKETQDKSFEHVAITSGISSRSLGNMLHLDFNSATGEQKKEKTHKNTHQKQRFSLHLAVFLT